jgi:hypothetical protein
MMSALRLLVLGAVMVGQAASRFGTVSVETMPTFDSAVDLRGWHEADFGGGPFLWNEAGDVVVLWRRSQPTTEIREFKNGVR